VLNEADFEVLVRLMELREAVSGMEVIPVDSISTNDNPPR
jgi:hypothetical protein